MVRGQMQTLLLEFYCNIKKTYLSRAIAGGALHVQWAIERLQWGASARGRPQPPTTRAGFATQPTRDTRGTNQASHGMVLRVPKNAHLGTSPLTLRRDCAQRGLSGQLIPLLVHHKALAWHPRVSSSGCISPEMRTLSLCQLFPMAGSLTPLQRHCAWQCSTSCRSCKSTRVLFEMKEGPDSDLFLQPATAPRLLSLCLL